ncbi:MAG: hypothetical protein QOE05_573, partial [Actinomycetota bacterium]|nr:hypothetical protein [Actinomycetota bacterium]
MLELGVRVELALVARDGQHVVEHDRGAAGPQTPQPCEHEDDTGFHLGRQHVLPLHVGEVPGPPRLPVAAVGRARPWVPGEEGVGAAGQADMVADRQSVRGLDRCGDDLVVSDGGVLDGDVEPR